MNIMLHYYTKVSRSETLSLCSVCTCVVPQNLRIQYLSGLSNAVHNIINTP